MDCVVDRFVETTNGELVDLATGEHVLMRIASAGGEAEQRRWTIRCDLFHKLHQPAIATLVDYGLVGEGRRFEAWRCSGPACEIGDATTVARAAASFLEACGLTTNDGQPGTTHRCGARVIVVPAPAAGYPNPLAIASRAAPVPIENCGVLYVERSAAGAIAELFDQHGCVPHAVGISGAPGAGKTTMARQLARAGRLHGYVPINARLLDTPLAASVKGRSALIIDDDAQAGIWSLLDAAVRWP